MDNTPQDFSTQSNPQYYSQQPSQYDSQSLSQIMSNPNYFPPPFMQFMSQPHYPSSQPSQAVDLQTPTTQKKKKGKMQQKERERNPNWTKNEDETLVKARLCISEDAEIGTDQKGVKLWDRVRDEFNRITGHLTIRSSYVLLNRWSVIQASVNKYSGCLRRVERAPRCGHNVEDSIAVAKQLYYDSEGHHFKFDGCWLLLKDSPKWFHYTKEQEDKKKKILEKKKQNLFIDVNETMCSNLSTPATTPSSVAGSVSLDDDESPFSQGPHELARPMGRKKTKERCLNKNADQVEAVNLFIAQFDSLRKEKKEATEQHINMAKEREMVRVQAKEEQDRRRAAVKLEQQKMKIAAFREQEQVKFEKDIMFSDPNSFPTEEGRTWLITQQKIILARMKHGDLGDGSSGSGE